MVNALLALLVLCLLVIAVLVWRIVGETRSGRRVRADERPHEGWTEG